MKKLILIGGLVVVLAAGGFAAWKFLLQSPEEPRKKEALVEKRVFHELKPFLVNLADPGGKRYLKVAIKLELSNPEVAAEITEKTFELRDGILMFLSSLEVDDVSLPAGKMTLKREVINRSNRMLKTGQISHVYFTEFLIQ